MERKQREAERGERITGLRRAKVSGLRSPRVVASTDNQGSQMQMWLLTDDHFSTLFRFRLWSIRVVDSPVASE